MLHLHKQYAKEMKRFFLFISIAVFTAQLFAGSPVIEGRITDAVTGESLTGVKVDIPGTDQQVITDFDGYFRIESIPEGSTQVKLSYLSYQTREVELSDKEHFLNLQMESVGAFRSSTDMTASNQPAE